MKILIAEDNQDLREMYRDYFSNGGRNQIIMAENGTKAWELVQEMSFDLIISDNNMPGMTGLEFVTRIKRVLNLKTPVVICSSDDVMDKAHELGVAFVDKLQFSKLQNLVRDVGSRL